MERKDTEGFSGLNSLHLPRVSAYTEIRFRKVPLVPQNNILGKIEKMTVKKLEQQAIDAHHRGVRFLEFWTRHESDVRDVVGHDRLRFAKLYHKLLLLVVGGDTDGDRPAGDGLPLFEDTRMPWEQDDASRATRSRRRGGKDSPPEM